MTEPPGDPKSSAECAAPEKNGSSEKQDNETSDSAPGTKAKISPSSRPVLTAKQRLRKLLAESVALEYDFRRLRDYIEGCHGFSQRLDYAQHVSRFLMRSFSEDHSTIRDFEYRSAYDFFLEDRKAEEWRGLKASYHDNLSRLDNLDRRNNALMQDVLAGSTSHPALLFTHEKLARMINELRPLIHESITDIYMF